MVRIALNMDDAAFDVLGPVTQRVHDHAAAHGAIWTGRAGFGGAGELEGADLGQCGAGLIPSPTADEAPMPAALIRKNCLRLIGAFMRFPLKCLETCCRWAGVSFRLGLSRGRVAFIVVPRVC